MKKLLPFLMVLTLLLLLLTGAIGQSHHVFPKGKNNFKAVKHDRTIDNADRFVGSQSYNPTVSVKSVLDDPSTAVTIYDLQTEGSTSPRIYRYPDGTIGAVCTWSATSSISFPDRGTGYNFFNGSSWGTQPTARIETSIRTGFPSYAPFGANGEIIIAHNMTNGATLVMSTRTSKGTGTWNVTQPAGLAAPTGAAVMGWPKMVTNGNQRTTIHIIALTEPVANGGTMYMGMDGALLYNHSTDGGANWTGWQLIPGMTSSEYQGFSGDKYAWAEPKGDTLCFTVGDNWNDQFIMKSIDNGTTWTKTKIWTCQYDLWPGNTNTDTFYCPDGFSAVALDKYGKAHIAFGLQRAVGDYTGSKYFFPWNDGLVYWNENMPELPHLMDPDTLLNHGNLIGWVPDTAVFSLGASALGYYFNSLSSMPVIATDRYNYVFVSWASVTTLTDPDGYMLRHLFARASQDGGWTWCDTIVDITGASQYDNKECVYPAISPNNNDSLFILFQCDDYASIYLYGSCGCPVQVIPTNNDMILIKPSKQSILKCIHVGFDQKKVEPSLIVYQNVPNPFSKQTTIRVSLNKPGNLSLEVSSILGQKILQIDKGSVAAGDYQFILNSEMFNSGIYLYTVTSNNESITKKLIVE
jgi:hypothetical protein